MRFVAQAGCCFSLSVKINVDDSYSIFLFHLVLKLLTPWILPNRLRLESNGTQTKGRFRRPCNFSLSPNFFQIGKFLSTTRTGCFRLHLNEPLKDTFLMKDMATSWVGTPYYFISNRIRSKTNSATIWY